MENWLIGEPREQTARSLGITFGNLQVVDNEAEAIAEGRPMLAVALRYDATLEEVVLRKVRWRGPEPVGGRPRR